MRVIVKEPNKALEIREIKDAIEVYHEIVDGFIETVTMNSKLLFICNEEGKLLNLKPNFLYNYDMIVGTVVFVGYQGENFISLTDEQIEYVKSLFFII